MASDNFERPPKYFLATSVEAIQAYIGTSKTVAFDIETSPDEPYRDDEKAALDPHKAHIVGVSFSVFHNSGIYVPVAHKNGPNVDYESFMSFFRRFLTSKDYIKICHNLAFESSFCCALGVIIQPPVFDTLCAAMLSLKNSSSFRKLNECGLKMLASEAFCCTAATYGDVTDGRHFDELSPLDFKTISYGAADSDYAIRFYGKFKNWFISYLPDHEYIAEKVESPAAVFTGLMRYNGIPVDIDAMHEARRKAVRMLDGLREKILEYTGDIEIGSNCSNAAFKKFIYSDCGLPVFKRTGSGAPSVDDEALKRLKDHCTETGSDLAGLFDLVAEYRRIQKLLSTYIDGYERYVNSASKRIHPKILPLNTETGRFSSSCPNMQNQVAAADDPLGIRNFITAPEGQVILECDYSQAEIRIAAYYAQENKLIDAYAKGEDIHAKTVSALYNCSVEEALDHSRPDYKTRRRVAKAVTFGVLYGISPKGLADNLYKEAGITLTELEAADFINGFLRAYPALAVWQKKMRSFAEKYKYVETDLGRRRYLPDLYSEDEYRRSAALRMAVNTPVQGLGADLLKLSMGRLVVSLKNRPYIRPILTVHDSLVFLVDEDKIEEAVEIVRGCMEAPPPLMNFVPMLAEASVGKRYGELE